jgi:hypothetical protein
VHFQAHFSSSSSAQFFISKPLCILLAVNEFQILAVWLIHFSTKGIVSPSHGLGFILLQLLLF